MMKPSEHVPEQGRTVAGRYELRELLGTGGMASVHRADDRFLGRTVAVKLFHADLTNVGDERRQAEEISLLASLNHPALVTLFDAGRDSEDAFLVMEYVDGADLRVRLNDGPIGPREAARIGSDVAAALAHIHARGVIHRDVKPANILLPAPTGSSGVPHAKLADFGIARLIDSTSLTATGTLIGTAAFLSPEQARGGEVGAPTDVYSLSLVLLEALTGERAFPGSAVESTLARLTRSPDVPDTLGPEWSELLRRGTARTPGERPTAEEFSSRLRGLASDDSTLVLPTAPDPTDETERLAPADAATARLAPADAETERLIPADAATERLAPAAAATQRPARPDRPAAPRGAGTLPRHRRPAIIAAAVLAVAAVALVVAVLVPRSAPADDADVTVQYPVVEGDLGAHLDELQRSVAP